MRATIFDSVVGRQRASCAIPAMNEGPRPMEVDAIMGGKGGKGKKGSTDTCRVCGKVGHFAKDCYFRDTGKGKGKPSSKGGGKGFGKSAANVEKFAGKCNYCQKTGHKQSECRKKEYDEKNTKGGGKAEPPDLRGPRDRKRRGHRARVGGAAGGRILLHGHRHLR